MTGSDSADADNLKLVATPLVLPYAKIQAESMWQRTERRAG